MSETVGLDKTAMEAAVDFLHASSQHRIHRCWTVCDHASHAMVTRMLRPACSSVLNSTLAFNTVHIKKFVRFKNLLVTSSQC